MPMVFLYAMSSENGIFGDTWRISNVSSKHHAKNSLVENKLVRLLYTLSCTLHQLKSVKGTF